MTVILCESIGLGRNRCPHTHKSGRRCDLTEGHGSPHRAWKRRPYAIDWDSGTQRLEWEGGR